MWKQPAAALVAPVALVALVALVGWAGPARALEPGDLVIGVHTDLYALDPETGALELLSEGPDEGRITGIAVSSAGRVFFTQASFLTATVGVWQLDPASGERRALAALGSAAGLALDGAASLVVPIADASSAPGLQPEILWLDAGTGAVQRVLPLPGTLIGISDVDLDREGRVLLSTSRAGIVRADPTTARRP